MTNSRRLHDRNEFYKYTTASTAELVIKNRRLRWSSPSIFNDPFDVPREILDGIDEDCLRPALVGHLKKIISGQVLPQPDRLSQPTKEFLLSLSKLDQNAKRNLIEGLPESASSATLPSGTLENIRSCWRSTYDEHRILCLTERWDRASMWDRYSDRHTGVVLEFSCVDHNDSPWLVAKPVCYSDEPLRYGTPEGITELMFYEPRYTAEKILEECTHTKTTDWSDEKEWRVASNIRPGESGEYSDWLFSPGDLTGIVFGSDISKNNFLKLVRVLEDRYPHTKLWQASFGTTDRRLIRTMLERDI